MMDKGKLIHRARVAKRESKYLDFKEAFDVESRGEWCEVVKDIVAMANSGGGVIVFGVKNNGRATRFDDEALREYDPAKITDKLARYTGRQFSDFELLSVIRGRTKKTTLVVGAASMPMVFEKPGTYRNEAGKEKVAFQEGTVYFRHGAKSQPGNESDLRKVVEREVNRQRQAWLGDIKKVTDAPAGSVVKVFKPGLTEGGPGDARVRLVTDPKAAPVRLTDGDREFPHRSKDVIELVNKRLGERYRINSHDMKCLKNVFQLWSKHPEFCYQPFATAAPQYNDAFVEWVVKSWEKDGRFFDLVRAKYRSMLEREPADD